MIKNPKHKEHEDALNWIGGSFDPEIFDDTMVNYRLELEAHRLNDWNVVKDLFIEDPGDWVDPNLACQQWLKTLQKRDKEAIDALPLRKDVFTLLSYLRDNKVVGTTSTGNFPRKDVKEFAGLMTKNPEIDLRKFGYISELRNEDEIFPLYFIHLMAYWAKLVEGGKGKRWVLSQKGEQFLKSSPSEQLHTLFVGWWFYANWTETQQTVQWISFLPVDFPRFIYIILTNIPPNKSMEYGNFLKIIKEALNYHWSEDQESRAYSSLGLAIDIIFIDPLEQLGLLVVNRKKIEIEGMTISNKVIDFRLSEFGKEAFRTIMDASFYRELKAKLN